jgi:hypothetical protein
MTDSRTADLSERESTLARRRATEGAERKPDTRPEHPVLRLQRQVGNAQVARMLAQRASEEEEPVQGKHDPALAQRAEEEEEVQGKHDPALAQREGEDEELQATHDPALAQREGEEEEEEVQGKHDPDLAQREGEEEEEVQGKHDPALAQREGEEEEEVEAKHDPALAQRKAEVGLEGGPLSEDLSSQIDAKRGGGSSLDDGIRTKAEKAMGTSLDGVRVHRDADADALNRSITAKAFTTGNDIFLREDQSPSDASLMLHELKHVEQQRTMGGGGGGMRVGAAGDQHEQDADNFASSVASGGAADAQRLPAEETAS